MEKAIHINNIKQIKLPIARYHRIYWGNEFCQNLIPLPADTDKILDYSHRHKLGFTFVTPFVTEEGLKTIESSLSWLKRYGAGCEIVVNDWGVLDTIWRRYGNFFEIVLGRLLTRQQRDPLMSRFLEKQPPLAVRDKKSRITVFLHRLPTKRCQMAMRSCYLNAEAAQSFLVKRGVVRIELNNVIQGIRTEGISLKKSLYTPYVHISSTRFCPMETKYQKIYRINVCRKECRREYDILRNKKIPKIIYRKGNSIFYKNPVVLERIFALGIDRVVYQQGLLS